VQNGAGEVLLTKVLETDGISGGRIVSPQEDRRLRSTERKMKLFYGQFAGRWKRKKRKGPGRKSKRGTGGEGEFGGYLPTSTFGKKKKKENPSIKVREDFLPGEELKKGFDRTRAGGG